ncbi:unnamed protein product [Periconia digitata]|uniref:Large ribosomal subunit protein mL67 n=1 Tax=Periconia digitata TaxID=1303443 RepID=A0A9W4UD00_9PLEO|nr:unnamed protein product [Periconia digitata]
MPRTLGRLRFRAPKPQKQVNVAHALASRRNRSQLLAEELTKHVHQLSNPGTPLTVRTVVDPGWKKPIGKRPGVKLPTKPLSLGDIVDPEGKAAHGSIIYVFRNAKTHQVIYSLSEMLDHYHLDQLPFMGRKSKPAVLRPDEWVPYFVATFPSPEQGHQAFRKLREYRKLHETAWHKTNPSWLKLPRDQRMRKIMNQEANSVADLAAVFRHQATQARLMRTTLRVQEEKTTGILQHKWDQIKELATLSTAQNKRDGDDIKWLTTQINNLTWQMGLKHNQDEGNQRRLQTAKASHENRIRNIEYAQRKAKQLAELESKLTEQATLANEAGSEQRLSTVEQEMDELRTEIADPEITTEQREHNRKILAEYRSEFKRLAASFEAKNALENRTHYIHRTILPKDLKEQPPQPFSLHGVSVQWADLRDLEYVHSWPRPVLMDTLPVNGVRQSVALLNRTEFDAAVYDEVENLMGDLGYSRERVLKSRKVSRATNQKTGVMGMVSKLNPFAKKQAEATA